jgi:DNA-binding transcriptional ArsR family regulator
VVTYDKVFNALGDPTRREVLELLAAGPASVEVLAAQMPVSRPAVSQHLKLLLTAGLVQVEQKGRKNIYSIAGDGFTELREYADRMWEQAFENFRNLAESGDLKDKRNDAAPSVTRSKEKEHDADEFRTH